MIGRGPSYPLALEAALKIKEVSYIHAEGFAGGELKHGVIALIEPGTPCLVLAPHDETLRDILSGAMEVKARGGYDHRRLARADTRPSTPTSRSRTSGDGDRHRQRGAGQLLGYYLCLLRGHDPDKPRNLAKSVTVKQPAGGRPTQLEAEAVAARQMRRASLSMLSATTAATSQERAGHGERGAVAAGRLEQRAGQPGAERGARSGARGRSGRRSS